MSWASIVRSGGEGRNQSVDTNVAAVSREGTDVSVATSLKPVGSLERSVSCKGKRKEQVGGYGKQGSKTGRAVSVDKREVGRGLGANK